MTATLPTLRLTARRSRWPCAGSQAGKLWISTRGCARCACRAGWSSTSAPRPRRSPRTSRPRPRSKRRPEAEFSSASAATSPSRVSRRTAAGSSRSARTAARRSRRARRRSRSRPGAWPRPAPRCGGGCAEGWCCTTSSTRRPGSPPRAPGARRPWSPPAAWTRTSPRRRRSSWARRRPAGSRRPGCRAGWSIVRGRSTAPRGGPRGISQPALSKHTGIEITIRLVNRTQAPGSAESKANGARVLIVDDEPNITELVAMALRYEGFSVKTAATGRGALTAVSQFSPALVILDVMLPDIDGLEVLRRLNSSGHKVPIIFLTAKDATDDKVHGLTVGGDDYVTKPFSIEELVARVRVVLRRNGASGAESGRLQLADLELDDEAHEVRRSGQVIALTTTEYRLLRYLLINAGRVLTRSQILDHVWHYDLGCDASVLETYISYLRRKIDRFEPPLVHTVRGVGYVLRAPRQYACPV